MKSAQKGFSTVVVFTGLLIVTGVAFAGWYVVDKNDSVIENKVTPAVIEEKESEKAGLSPLTLSKQKLPAGWTVEVEDANHVTLKNSNTNCFTDVIYTTDTAESNSPEVDHNKQTVDAIKAKGYIVTESKDNVSISTTGGEMRLDAQALEVNADGISMSQKYAYISTVKLYSQVQISCSNKSDLASAQEALKAIVFSEVN